MAENDPIEQNIAEGGLVEEPPKDKERSYQMMGSSKIPVSKHMGKTWKGRIDASLTARERSKVAVAWDEALRYYHNDQLGHRGQRIDGAGNRAIASADNNEATFAESENIVYANINALGPSLFSKQPAPEITANDPEEAGLSSIRAPAEKLLKTLGARKYAPGFNLKSRVRRAITLASLTNCAWATVDYTQREEGTEQAVRDLQTLGEALQKAKSIQEIESIEGKIQAIEQTFSFLRNSGFRVRIWSPLQFVTPPEHEEDDLSDCPWLAYYDFMPTAYLRARFFKEKKKGDGMQYTSIYQPTHVMNAQSEQRDIDEQIANFSLLGNKESEDHEKFGYSSKQAFDAAKYTKVWYVWDMVTRRVMLFNDKDWTWPIWVWEDPYRLQEFFNATKLSFVTDPQGGDTKGEVTYYLDQQDAINVINSEEARAREWAKRNVLFDKNAGLKQSDVEEVLRGPNGTARGVDLPEGRKIDDIIGSIKPPMAAHKELFRKDHKYAAIDRISHISSVMRGEEFKTNTTNDAIAKYEETNNIAMDARVDRVEDFIADIYWKVLQIALQKMTTEEVAELIGPSAAGQWRQMTYDEIRSLSLQVVGGSTQKPTSKAKKREAIEVGQVLGQFVDTSPMVVVVMLKMLQRAFDEIVIFEEDWQMITDSVMQAIQGQGAGGDDLAQVIDSLPPQVKEALGKIIAQGVPVEQALQEVQRTLSQGASNAPRNEP